MKGTRASVSADEKTAIGKASEDPGVSVKKITDTVREHKLAHPPAQGLAGLEFTRTKLGDPTPAKPARNGNPALPEKPGRSKYTYKTVPYTFSNAEAVKGKKAAPLADGSPEYQKRVTGVAKGVLEEVRRVFSRSVDGDQNAKNILAEASWYKAMRSSLRRDVGGMWICIPICLATPASTPRFAATGRMPSTHCGARCAATTTS